MLVKEINFNSDNSSKTVTSISDLVCESIDDFVKRKNTEDDEENSDVKKKKLLDHSLLANMDADAFIQKLVEIEKEDASSLQSIISNL